MRAPLTSAASAEVQGTFDLVLILTVWTEAQREVGGDDRGGYHNKT